MKTIEEKAKRYDEALEELRGLLEGIREEKCKILEEDITSIFPELQENEDERIRKELIFYLGDMPEDTELRNGVTNRDVLVWLEKQGEQKPQGKTALEAINEEKVDNQFCVKSTNKVEPKFKIGDWIIHRGTENIYQVVAVIDNQYQLKYGDNYTVQNCADVDRCARLYDVTKDAKDGDVLQLGKVTAIFQNYISNIECRCYCSVFEGEFKIPTQYADTYGCHNAIPANKEQRDTLMKAMADAGYTFDFEKKELKKIKDEIEIPFGAKDSELQEVTYYIPKGFHAEIDGDKVVIKKGEKPIWSEMDKAITRAISSNLELLKNRGDGEVNEAAYQSEIKWLKDLKDRVGCEANCTTTKEWKPSDAQIIALNDIILNGHLSNANERILKGLQEQLMKLKGE